MYDLRPAAVVCDLHPDYLSTQSAQKSGLPVVAVQHHYAHVLACMAENHLDGTVLGISWDGTGYGLDHTIWGGEFLRVTESGFERVAHLRTFGLPGGDKAVRQPRRTALGLLYEIFGDDLFTMHTWHRCKPFPRPTWLCCEPCCKKNQHAAHIKCRPALRRDRCPCQGCTRSCNSKVKRPCTLNSPSTASTRTNGTTWTSSNHQSRAGRPLILDWAPLVRGVLDDVGRGVSTGLIAAQFHNTLVEAIVAVALRSQEKQVILTGGCFQNKYLTERTVSRLRSENIHPYWHRQIPPNDGGIAVGQVLAAAREMRMQDHESGVRS